MHLTGRRTASALVAALLALTAAPSFAAPTPAPKATPRKMPSIRPGIAIAVNGQELPPNPAPRIVGKGGGRLVVPVVRIYAALGIATQRIGDEIVASAPGKRIVVRDGSAMAEIDGRPVLMEAPAQRIDGATYVPLRFVADSLGAQATFDAQAMRVEVVSALVGRNPNLEQAESGGSTQVVGTVSAVDRNSEPPSLTLTRGADVRTIAVTSDAKVVLQDVVARTTTVATLADVHVGDAASAIVLHDGHVGSIVVRFASRVGTIAAVSPSQFVLDTGFIASPDKTTIITLDGQPAALADLRVGDSVTVRLNPDTNEKREIVASRLAEPSATSAATAAGGPAIAAFAVRAPKVALRGGDAFEVTMTGTPGGRATFDVGTFVVGQPLTEGPPGTYTARYVVPANVNFGRAPVLGHLTVAGASAPQVAAATPIAVSNTPPSIVEVAPANGQTVNADRPSIFATFASAVGVGIDPDSVSIAVNGHDVTAAATRTDQFVIYGPGVDVPDGPVSVTVRASDRAGNAQSRTWTFTVRAH
jgi:hypothetical protein